MRWTRFILLVGSITAAACHGPPLKEGGSAGNGGSGTVGTGGAATGTAGAGTAGAGTVGTAGRGGGGRGGNGGTTGTNACLRCDTPCQDGICELALVRKSQSVVYSSATSTALSDGRLYFVVGLTDGSAGIQVLSIPTGGVPEMELYSPHSCSGCRLSVAVDGSDVFFAGLNSGGMNAILAVPKGGGTAARTVCTTPSAIPFALTVEGDYVYYVRADTGIERCLKAGGSATMHAATVGSPSSPNVVIRMTSRPGALVWGDRDTGVVTRLDTNMLTTKTIGITRNPEPTTVGPCDAADDGTLAYWVLCAWAYNVYVENGTNMATERGSALGGGDPNAIFDEYGSIGLDGQYIYFTEAGFLNRVPKTGGSVEARARMFDGSGFPIKALIVGFDATYAYLALAESGDGAIYKVAK